MKYIVVVITTLMLLSGCGFTFNTADKIDADVAKYLDVPKLTINHRAGIAQVDMDLSADPVSVRRIEAIKKYADEESPEYQLAYSKFAWLYYQGFKLEGAIKKWIQRVAQMGTVIP